jgi:hypothetical protein
MNARLVGRRIRWMHLARASIGFGLLAGACAEPATVNPALVPEASVDARPETGDADLDAEPDASTGGGGSGGSGGSGGTGGTGGTAGARPDAGDARDEAADASVDANTDAPTDAPSGDTSVPPDGSADVTSDPVAEPPIQDGGRGDQDGARGDVVTDVTADRDSG